MSASGDSQPAWWDVAIEGMPHFDTAMKRIYAWFDRAIIDRPPVRFVAHNAFVEEANTAYPSDNIRERWFDVEFQVDTYLKSIEGKTYRGETFPVFWPNLGPEIYAAFYGAELEYGEVTSWSIPFVKQWEDADRLTLDMTSSYFATLEALTELALERCAGKSLVGYTDLHPGVDCVAAWRDPQQLCLDMLENPAQVKRLINLAIHDFDMIYSHFDAMLKARKQLSVSWMGIPSFGRMHIPSCDFSALISPKMFEEFCLPVLQHEVTMMTHNVFHVDGKGVARHIDAILDVPGVHAIQWVQGVGDDYPIMQWVPFIKKVQARAPIIVDLDKRDLDSFMDAVEPEGIFLWIATETEDEEHEILKRVAHWAGKRVH